MVVFPQNPLQPEISSFFETALETDSISHAYLFVGSHPDAQLEMARNLAASLVESDRSLIDAGTHPDVREYKPGATVGYLSEQITELINEVQLSPSRGRRKVFIVQDAHSLTDKTANALLKTLEEPPPGVTFLLLARSEAIVLSTIVSRSQLIRLRNEDEGELVGSLMQKRGDFSEADVVSALHIASSPQAALALLESVSERHAQAMLLETIAALPTFSTWQLLQKAQEVLAALDAKDPKQKTTKVGQATQAAKQHAPQDTESQGTQEVEQRSAQEAERQAELRTEQQAAIEKEFLSTKAIKELEKAQKRSEAAASAEALERLLVSAELFLRDIVALEAGVSKTTLALPDTLDTTRHACNNWDSSQALQGIEIVQAARKDMRHNVAARLALEAMLCHMEDILCQK